MKRVLITRPKAQANGMAEGLRAAGYEPVFCPVIEIRAIDANAELDEALQNLDRYSWLVFTSVNAVGIVFRNPHAGEATKFLSGDIRVAAIGPRTAEALAEHGVTPDFVPDEYVAEAILPGLGDLRGKRVLLPRADIARKALPEAIAAAGGSAHEIAVYRTVAAEPAPEAVAALRAGVDVISLTSPSTVEHFISLARDNGLDPLQLPGDPLIACIGPVTEGAARAAGLTRVVVADEYTAEGLIRIIADSVNA
jgi:uroporphyrinogen III methyltransferase / synthase